MFRAVCWIRSPASSSQSWTLDAQGNWTSVTTDGTTQSRTANAENQVISVGGATLTYDANGNLTTDEIGRQLVYDAWNRLVLVKDSSGATLSAYSYDALGRQVTEGRGRDGANCITPQLGKCWRSECLWGGADAIRLESGVRGHAGAAQPFGENQRCQDPLLVRNVFNIIILGAF